MDLDLSQINLANDPDGVFLMEIRSVLQNAKRRIREIQGYPRKYFYHISTGYSSKKRILLIASRIVTDKLQILGVKVADEKEIENFYCGG